MITYKLNHIFYRSIHNDYHTDVSYKELNMSIIVAYKYIVLDDVFVCRHHQFIGSWLSRVTVMTILV